MNPMNGGRGEERGIFFNFVVYRETYGKIIEACASLQISSFKNISLRTRKGAPPALCNFSHTCASTSEDHNPRKKNRVEIYTYSADTF